MQDSRTKSLSTAVPKGMPFKRNDGAKAFFDLDISDAAPSNTVKTTKALHGNPPTSKSFNVANAKRTSKVTFLTLPVEIRLQIYDLLLVSRFDCKKNPSWAVKGKAYQKLVLLSMIQARQYRTMEPQLLQTCKQVYHEGNPMLYSYNFFKINEPKELLRLIMQIGPTNIKLVRSLDIWVPFRASSYELPLWLGMLTILATEATGLHYILLEWGASWGFPLEFERGTEERGLGDNLEFVRALGRIKGLNELVFKGHFAKHWPTYLEKTIGVRVRAEPALLI